MRIRSFKPEFWRSPDIAALEIPERLLFLALWSYVDDNGVGIDRLADIVADCWAPDLEKDPAGTFERVSHGLQQLAASGRIIRYEGHRVESDAELMQLLYIVNWDRHQRINRPNLPRFTRPTCVNDDAASSLQQVAANSWSGTGEQGNRGTDIDTSTRTRKPSTRKAAVDSDEFKQFWAVYPKKQSKGQARAAFEKALTKADVSTLVEGARVYRDSKSRDPKFTKNASTWLNGECWEDEAEVAVAVPVGGRMWQE